MAPARPTSWRSASRCSTSCPRRACESRPCCQGPPRPSSGTSPASVDHLPKEIVMSAEDMVDAALAGLDAGEFATIPSLPELAEWDADQAARRAMSGKLSNAVAAPRYGIGRERAAASNLTELAEAASPRPPFETPAGWSVRLQDRARFPDGSPRRSPPLARRQFVHHLRRRCVRCDCRGTSSHSRGPALAWVLRPAQVWGRDRGRRG